MKTGEQTLVEGDADGSMASLLCALSLATSLGLGDRMEHGIRSAFIGLRLSDALGVDEADREATFYGALLKDSGCTACSSVVAAFFPDQPIDQMDLMMRDRSQLEGFMTLVTKYVPLDSAFPKRVAKLLSFVAHCQPVLREGTAGHCEVAELFARRLGFPERVQKAVRFQWERWDSKGNVYGLRGEEVPVASRILHLAQMVEFAYEIGGTQTAETLARERSSSRFDPELASAFLDLSARADFWATIEHNDLQAVILSMKPSTTADDMVTDRTDAVCEALADLVDAKTRITRDHGYTVADVAMGIGGALGLEQSDLSRLRRAALVHDLGLVAVPTGVLEKADRLTASESDQHELHPHYTKQILQRVGSLRELALDAGDHHERPDGTGYPSQRRGNQLSLTSQVLAVADRYGDGIQQGDDAELVVQRLRSSVGQGLDGTCYEALVRWLGGSVRTRSRRPAPAHGLTERELEVLKLLVEGLNNPQISDRLFVSRKTVEHHVEHIFDKLDVTSRTAAVVYAVHNGLS